MGTLSHSLSAHLISVDLIESFDSTLQVRLHVWGGRSLTVSAIETVLEVVLDLRS